MISSVYSAIERLTASRKLMAFFTVLPLILLNPLQANAIEFVVFSIEGTVKDLTLGQKLNEGHSFELPENSSVNLINKLGEVITFNGPTTATLVANQENEKGEQALASISNLLFEEDRFVQAIGGTRDSNDETNVQKLFEGTVIDSPWSPLLSEVNTYCVKQEEAYFRRESADGNLLLRLKNKKVIRWDAGFHKVDLSSHIQANGQQPALSFTIGGRRILFFAALEQYETVAEEAAWLARMGCTEQALMLLANEATSSRKVHARQD
ncbi:MAG: hypothetical protein AAF423_04400 [Pseudomonadota bacterium]